MDNGFQHASSVTESDEEIGAHDHEGSVTEPDGDEEPISVDINSRYSSGVSVDPSRISGEATTLIEDVGKRLLCTNDVNLSGLKLLKFFEVGDENSYRDHLS